MDGNGRWASERGFARSLGHKQGMEALRAAVKAAPALGVEILTIYSFSTENWSRPKSEVSFLMQLLKHFFRQDVAILHAEGVRIRIIGSRTNIEPSIVSMLDDAEKLTRNNTALQLVVAFNYGSREELVTAVKTIAKQVVSEDIIVDQITEETVSRALYTKDIPDPDLLIRTGGEMRISNFLLWQCAYTEFVFAPEYWPDFTGETLARCISEYCARDRRFWGIKVITA